MTGIQYQSGAVAPTNCIGTAWELLTRKFWFYIGAGFVTLVLIGCVPFVAWFLYGPVIGGFYYLTLRDLRGEPVDFGMLFKGFDKFVPLMIAGLIQQIPAIVLTIIQWTVDAARFFGNTTPDVNFYQGTDQILAGISVMVVLVVLVVMLVAIVWTIALSFAVPLIMEHDLSVGDALITSAKAIAANAGRVIVLVILEFFVAMLGLIAICLGLFVAIPVIYLANVVAYRQVFPDRGGPVINTAPPPPDYYAGTFGRGQ